MWNVLLRRINFTQMNILRLPVLILLLIVGLTPASQDVLAADKLAGKKKEMERLKSEMLDKKREIEQANRRERSVLSEIEQLDKTIQNDSAELARQEKQLQEAEASLRAVRKTNAFASQGLSTLKRTYRDRIRALYKMGRTGYAVTVLTAEDLTTALKRIKYLTVIAERDRQIIATYRSSLDTLSQRQADIARRTEERQQRKRSIETTKAELELQRSKKATILASVKKEKSTYEGMLSELEESSANLWKMIQQVERDREAARKAKANQIKPPTAAPVRQGNLPWPILGEVVTRFGMQRHPQFGTIVFRRGIEIQARPGEQVYAVNDGTVAFADWYKGYGKLVILDHGAGVYSLYGYLSQHDISKGDRVQRGQTVGLVGDTGSSKGAKLYFEIRSNGEAQDPLAWLAQR